jgi:hypothetical protein
MRIQLPFALFVASLTKSLCIAAITVSMATAAHAAALPQRR